MVRARKFSGALVVFTLAAFSIHSACAAGESSTTLGGSANPRVEQLAPTIPTAEALAILADRVHYLETRNVRYHTDHLPEIARRLSAHGLSDFDIAIALRGSGGIGASLWIVEHFYGDNLSPLTHSWAHLRVQGAPPQVAVSALLDLDKRMDSLRRFEPSVLKLAERATELELEYRLLDVELAAFSVEAARSQITFWFGRETGNPATDAVYTNLPRDIPGDLPPPDAATAERYQQITKRQFEMEQAGNAIWREYLGMKTKFTAPLDDATQAAPVDDAPVPFFQDAFPD